MRLIKRIKLIYTFYSSFILLSTIITISCLTTFWKNGFGIFAGLFWFKIITLAIIFHFINGYKSKEFYYYQNLGISKNLLFTTTFIFDFSLFLFSIFQIHPIK